MLQERPIRRSHAARLRRAGLSYQPVLVAVPAVALVGAMLSWWAPWRSSGDKDSGVVTAKVERGEFVDQITDRGEVQSASNVEIRCEVQTQGGSGTTILQIIAEGTYVKPGDQLAKLDSSSLETQLTQQQIACNTSEASMIQAKNVHETAKIAREEYLQGTFVQAEDTIQSEILLANEDHRRAEQSLKYTADLFARGYVTRLQLEADEFAVKKAKMTRSAAETKLRVLREYTRQKMITQLDSDIKTAEAKLRAEEHSHKLDMEKKALIESQIQKCTIVAPTAGQVVYANVNDRRAGTEVIIEEGATVRERQVIFRLPDPKNMQVNAKINEAKISRVAVGMPATIRLDAFPDVELTGKVAKVNEYPAPPPWGSNVKEYETVIRIDSTPPGMRPGLTAEVKIRSAHMADILRVPVQAVFEHHGKHYCLFVNDRGFEARPVEVGLANDKYVVIRSGLSEGEEVVMGAAAYRDKAGLPRKPKGEPPPEGKTDRSPGEKPEIAPGDGPRSKPDEAAGKRPRGPRRPAGGTPRSAPP